jgi:predicted amidophosphoribosyltransferase
MLCKVCKRFQLGIEEYCPRCGTEFSLFYGVTVSLQVNPEINQQITDKAKSLGMTKEEYICKLIENDLIS